MPQGPDMQGILVRVPKDVHKKLKAKAKADNRTLNGFIADLLIKAAKRKG